MNAQAQEQRANLAQTLLTMRNFIEGLETQAPGKYHWKSPNGEYIPVARMIEEMPFDAPEWEQRIIYSWTGVGRVLVCAFGSTKTHVIIREDMIAIYDNIDRVMQNRPPRYTGGIIENRSR